MNESTVYREFGQYLIEVSGNQATIRRHDRSLCNPSFVEIQRMKELAFDGANTVSGFFHRFSSHQRHLPWVAGSDISILKTDRSVVIINSNVGANSNDSFI